MKKKGVPLLKGSGTIKKRSLYSTMVYSGCSKGARHVASFANFVNLISQLASYDNACVHAGTRNFTVFYSSISRPCMELGCETA